MAFHSSLSSRRTGNLDSWVVRYAACCKPQPLLPLSSRYQPDWALEGRAATAERDYLSSGEGESDLTESESHLHMLKSSSSAVQTVLHPPASPSEQSSSVVNMSICVLGKANSLFISMLWPQTLCIMY